MRSLIDQRATFTRVDLEAPRVLKAPAAGI